MDVADWIIIRQSFSYTIVSVFRNRTNDWLKCSQTDKRKMCEWVSQPASQPGGRLEDKKWP